MGNDHQCGLSDGGVVILKVLVEVGSVWFGNIGESVDEITDGDDDVGLGDGVDLAFQETEEKVKVLLTEFRADGHELAQSQNASSFDHRVSN